MIADLRRSLPMVIALLALLALIVVIVFGGSASPEPSPRPAGSASVAPATASASASTSASPASSGSVAPSATATPQPSPSSAACAVTPEDGLLPSDRVVSVEVSTSPTADFVTFVFDDGSLTPAGPPRGELTAATPPFTYASSGLPIDLQGQRAVQVRLSGMSLYNDVGEPTFTGDRDITVDYPALRQVVLFDESEGVAGWYVGYDGNGCVDLVRDGTDIVITIAHS